MLLHYKDLAAPPIVSASIWAVVYLLTIESNTQYAESAYIGCFSIALIFFSIGFIMTSPHIVMPVISKIYSVRINPILSKPVLAFEYVSTAFFIFSYRYAIINRTSSLWMSLRNAEIENSYFLEMLVIGFPIVTATALYVYLKTPNKRNRNYFLLTIPPLILVLLTSHRTAWFNAVSMFLFIVIFTKRLRNKSIIKLATLGVVIVALLFVVSTLAKFSNVMIASTNTEKILYYVRLYFVSPPIAFLQWLEGSHNFTYGYGKYTCRFFLALLHVIIPAIEVPNTVMEFTEVDGMPTNVYTILHWYSMDGGLVWAYAIQFFIGMLLGIFYKRVKKYRIPEPFSVLMLSMMMSIILGEFFCDQLAVHISMWIQRILWCLFCCKFLIQNVAQRHQRVYEHIKIDN